MNSTELKRCSGCSNDLPLSAFQKNVTRKDGFSHYCKLCKRLADKRYYAKVYGIGRCPTCGRKLRD